MMFGRKGRANSDVDIRPKKVFLSDVSDVDMVTSSQSKKIC